MSNARTNLHEDITPCSPPVTVVIIEMCCEFENGSTRLVRTRTSLHHPVDVLDVDVLVSGQRRVEVSPPRV